MERDIFGKIVDSPKVIKTYQELLSSFEKMNNDITDELIDIASSLTGGEIDAGYYGVLQDFINRKGIYIAIHPEFYSTGINWNWQLWWYLPKEKWTEHRIEAGTYLYGDNNEYPSRQIAELSAFHMAVRLLCAKMPVGQPNK